MPKPTLPPHAGPYQPAYSSNITVSSAEDMPADSSGNESVKQVLPSPSMAFHNHLEETQSLMDRIGSHPALLVWVALVFLGLGIIFAIYAIIHHG